MTPAERANPQLINGSRKAELPKAADGVEINRLLKQFSDMQKMMRAMQNQSNPLRMMRKKQSRR